MASIVTDVSTDLNTKGTFSGIFEYTDIMILPVSLPGNSFFHKVSTHPLVIFGNQLICF